MIVKCKTCNIELTRDLIALKELDYSQEKDNEDLIPKGYFFIPDEEFYSKTLGKVMINIDDLINSKSHPDSNRSNGCCSLDGMDGMNKVCANGHEIATECSDCWMPHYTVFENEVISIG